MAFPGSSSGPASREDSGASWGVAIVANYGLSNDLELVIEGTVIAESHPEPEEHRTRLIDTALSAKYLLRRGSLQESTGASVAGECGMLLPTIHDEDNVGGECALIASRRWPMLTVHLNGVVEYARDHRWNTALGAILEGPEAWPLRPVAEVLVEDGEAGASTRAALIGLIWQASGSLSWDVGLRYADTDGAIDREVRAGVTWAL